jgi:hypothetical protein
MLFTNQRRTSNHPCWPPYQCQTPPFHYVTPSNINFSRHTLLHHAAIGCSATGCSASHLLLLPPLCCPAGTCSHVLPPYGQCGGLTASCEADEACATTCCSDGFGCSRLNDYYWQCQPGGPGAVSATVTAAETEADAAEATATEATAAAAGVPSEGAAWGQGLHPPAQEQDAYEQQQAYGEEGQQPVGAYYSDEQVQQVEGPPAGPAGAAARAADVMQAEEPEVPQPEPGAQPCRKAGRCAAMQEDRQAGTPGA